MTQEKLSDEELAMYVWAAAAAHAGHVHGGGVDKQCDACTQLCNAIDEIETALYQKQGTDDHIA